MDQVESHDAEGIRRSGDEPWEGGVVTTEKHVSKRTKPPADTMTTRQQGFNLAWRYRPHPNLDYEARGHASNEEHTRQTQQKDSPQDT